ncbi:MAG: SURF1 family protein [Idiomarina sp.]|nr:SURF1 family protein [Idiomarina sp.]
MTVLRLGSLLFRFHPGALLITLLAIAVMVKLGFWQIDRGQEKQAIIDRYEASEQQFVLHADNIAQAAMRPDSEVRVTATLHPEYVFYIDNQIHQGRAGYHVLALATSTDLNPYLLPVNLGWIPGERSRAQLPNLSLPTEPVTVVGRVRLPAENPFMLGEQNFTEQPGWPLRIQYPELDKMAQALNLPLASFMVLQSPDAEFGYVREWPVVVMTPHRHYAYAVQWFGLALAALIIFFVASREKPAAKQEQE